MNREHFLDDLEKYPVEGGDIPPILDRSDGGYASWHIRLLACLQREQMIWRSQPEYPYLSVDAEALNRCHSTIGRAVLLAHEFLLQNLSRKELGRIMAAGIVGGGVYAGITPTSDFLPEGAANPNAHCLCAFNHPLYIRSTPFMAEGIWLLVLDEDQPYQYAVADIDSSESHSFPLLNSLPLGPYRELQSHFRERYRQSRKPLNADELAELDEFISTVFEANQKVLKEAEHYHLRHKDKKSRYTHPAPWLTPFGRLVHDEEGEPSIEHNLALLHCTKAIEEFNCAKNAEDSGNDGRKVIHGAYCIIALAAFIEAAANRAYFVSKGSHVVSTDNQTSTARLLSEAEQIAHRRDDAPQRRFKRLKQSSEEYRALEEVRQIRNKLIHATEAAVPIDQGVGASELVACLTVENCRRLLSLVRKALVHIVEQVPEIGLQVRLDEQGEMAR